MCKFDNRAILIHKGNKPNHTAGCLLPGNSKSVDFVGDSDGALGKIMDYVFSKDWMSTLNIFNAFKLATMNRIICTICFYFISSTCIISAQGKTSEYDIENLKKCYFLVCDSETYEAQKKYFDAFPTIFNDFNTAFAYNERIANENLYEESLDYITKFFHLYKNINPHELSNKIISICINGRWDADAVNYLQTNVINIVTSSYLSKNNCYDSSDIFPCFNDTLRDALLSRLALLSDDEVLSFWKFYLDRPETMPVDEKLYQQTKTIIQEYPNLLRQLQNAYIHTLLNNPNENDIE